ncbi:uncharacterized protein K452DRAFT_160748 [Aplosporella prunicola CBS 121167]|uniref:Extracellular membrane protein CFEM domain-containing protein n=1 Tax=Aplosporella prunicola CBS 121167 TaxID=1176127 RepID=A0A6A6BK29_9PEZI|nr:uncharacterized protein K452DRAFT_160748 [Aplosporella prunicola CBS 121167]KAF2143654.1 hypothetical protein K452DRAFT_160748 [Aplosporella prunicola CBS 121167]
MGYRAPGRQRQLLDPLTRVPALPPASAHFSSSFLRLLLLLCCFSVRADAMRCDAMRCDAMRCDAMRCDASPMRRALFSLFSPPSLVRLRPPIPPISVPYCRTQQQGLKTKSKRHQWLGAVCTRFMRRVRA